MAGNQYLRRHALRRILSPPLSGPLKSKCNARPEVIEAKSQQRIPGLISLHQANAAAHLVLGEDYVQSGLPSRGISELKRPASLSGGSPLYTAQVAVALAVGDGIAMHSELHANWGQSPGSVTFRLTDWPRSMQRYTRMRMRSNGCRPRMTITRFGWDTLLLTQFSTDTARMRALRIFSGA